MNPTNLLLGSAGEAQNCHLQLFTNGRKPRQSRGKETQISQVPHTEREIHALDCLKLPVGRPSSNAFANQRRGFPCALCLHVPNQPRLARRVMQQNAGARGSKSKPPSSCVTGVSLGYTSAHTQTQMLEEEG